MNGEINSVEPGGKDAPLKIWGDNSEKIIEN